MMKGKKEGVAWHLVMWDDFGTVCSLCSNFKTQLQEKSVIYSCCYDYYQSLVKKKGGA